MHKPYTHSALIGVMLLCLCFYSGASQAKNPQRSLDDTLQEIEQAKQREAEILSAKKTAQEELEALQTKLVSMAEKFQEQEALLASVDEKQGILTQQLLKRERDVKSRKQVQIRTIQSLIELGQTPPAAVVVMPTDYAKALRAAQVIGIASHSLKTEMEAIESQIKELEELKSKVATNHLRQLAARSRLQKERQALDEAIRKRKELSDILSEEQDEIAKQMKKLSRESEDLRDLVRAAELERGKRNVTRNETDGIKEKAPDGRAFLPASGKIIQHYGDKKTADDTYRGVVVVTADHAQVVAPYAGEVVFTGPFRDYGNMVILRHNSEYHTLIAGLRRIDCATGQHLYQGEPLGIAGDKDDAGNKLYVELRKEGRPVNPLSWMTARKTKD